MSDKGAEFLGQAKGVTAEFQKQAALLKEMAGSMKQLSAGEEDAGEKAKDLGKGLDVGGVSAGLIGKNMLTTAGAIGVAVEGAHALYAAIDDAYQKTAALEQEWGSLGAKLAIGQTAKHELQEKIFKQLGGKYDQVVNVGLKYGIDEDKAATEAKELLNAKFKDTEVPVLIKLAAGGNLLGGGQGDALIREMEKIKLEPKVKSKDLDGLWKLGIKSKDVFADLDKQLGKTGEAQRRLKAGTLDNQMAIEAIERAGQKSFGPLADLLKDDVLVQLDRLKGDAEHLFDHVDIGPFKDALKNVLGAIEGGPGQELKAGIQDLFGSAFGVAFGDLAGGKGKTEIASLFHAIAVGAHEAAAEVRALEPVVKDLLDTLHKMEKDGSLKALVGAGALVAKEKIAGLGDEAKATTTAAKVATGKSADVGGTSETVQAGRRKLGDVGAGALGGIAGGLLSPAGLFGALAGGLVGGGAWVGRKVGGLFDDAQQPGASNAMDASKSGAPDASSGKTEGAAGALPDAAVAGAGDTNAAGLPLGQDMDDGMAQGITDGSVAVEAASAAMADRAVQSARQRLDAHSPSEEFVKIGGTAPAGMEKGMDAHPGPAAAGKRMAGRAIGGAQGGGAGGGSGGGGSGGGNVYNFSPQIALPPGSAAENAKAVEQALAKAYPVFLAMMRRQGRDAGEGSSAP